MYRYIIKGTGADAGSLAD